MSYVRSKMINGYGPYYYEVESVRDGDKVEQRYIAYLGKNRPSETPKSTNPSQPDNIVPNKSEGPQKQESPYDRKIRENDQKYLDKESKEYQKGYKEGVGREYYNEGMKEKGKPSMSYENEKDGAKGQLYRSANLDDDVKNRKDWNEKRGYIDGLESAHEGNGPEYGRIQFNFVEHAIDKHADSYKIYRYKDGDYIFKNDEKIRIDD